MYFFQKQPPHPNSPKTTTQFLTDVASVSQTSQPLKRLKNIPTAPQPAPNSKTRQFRQDFSTWQISDFPIWKESSVLVGPIPGFLHLQFWATCGPGGALISFLKSFTMSLWIRCFFLSMNFLMFLFFDGFVLRVKDQLESLDLILPQLVSYVSSQDRTKNHAEPRAMMMLSNPKA